MITCSSILAWKIPWTDEPGGLQSMGSQRVRQDLACRYKCMNVGQGQLTEKMEWEEWLTTCYRERRDCVPPICYTSLYHVQCSKQVQEKMSCQTLGSNLLSWVLFCLQRQRHPCLYAELVIGTVVSQHTGCVLFLSVNVVENGCTLRLQFCQCFWQLKL